MLESLRRQNELGLFGNGLFGLRMHAFLQSAGRAGLRAKYPRDEELHAIAPSTGFLSTSGELKVPTGFNGVYFPREEKSSDIMSTSVMG